MSPGRERGIKFDVGHGGGSFIWPVAMAAAKAGFFPDSISTDLHTGSMNGAMKDQLNAMSKIIEMGASLEDVVRMSTMTPAEEIKRPELGSLELGAEADVAVLRLDTGKFGFVDTQGGKRMGSKLLVCEMTIRKGKVVWDLNGRVAPDWKTHTYRYQMN